MHELSLVESLLEILASEAQAQGYRRVTGIALEVGHFSHADPQALQFCFDVAAQGTLAQGAVLEITHQAGAGQCRVCGSQVALANRYDPCSRCGAFGVAVSQGEALRIKSIEVI